MSFLKKLLSWDLNLSQKAFTTAGIASKQGSLLTPHGNKLPPAIHQELHLDWLPEDGRLIVIGDVHGCLIQLKELLKKVSYIHKKDCLVLVGDLVNKGPASCETIDLAMQNGVLSVLGNHDDAALAAYSFYQLGSTNKTFHNFEWAASMSEVQAGYLASLPFTLSIPELKIIIVHAGLVPGVSLERQSLSDMTKMRFLKKRWAIVEALEVWDKGCIQWASVWNGPQHVIFGHDARRGLQLKNFVTGLDAACVYGGQLAACLIPAGKLIQNNANSRTQNSQSTFNPTAQNLEIEVVTVAGHNAST